MKLASSEGLGKSVTVVEPLAQEDHKLFKFLEAGFTTVLETKTRPPDYGVQWTRLSSPDALRPAYDHLRSVMSNVLGEFSALVEEDELDIADFRGRWLEPSVDQILDALRDGVLKGEDKLRRDASLWLRFLRTSLVTLEENKNDDSWLDGDGCAVDAKDRINKQRRWQHDRNRLRTAIAQKGRAAYLRVS